MLRPRSSLGQKAPLSCILTQINEPGAQKNDALMQIQSDEILHAQILSGLRGQLTCCRVEARWGRCPYFTLHSSARGLWVITRRLSCDPVALGSGRNTDCLRPAEEGGCLLLLLLGNLHPKETITGLLNAEECRFLSKFCLFSTCQFQVM